MILPDGGATSPIVTVRPVTSFAVQPLASFISLTAYTPPVEGVILAGVVTLVTTVFTVNAHGL